MRMNSCIKLRSAGHRKSPGCALLMRSRRSRVYRSVGTKGGGLGLRVGKVARGSPIILRIIRNLSGSLPMIGQTFLATGLYFFFVLRNMSRKGRSCFAVDSGVSCRDANIEVVVQVREDVISRG